MHDERQGILSWRSTSQSEAQIYTNSYRFINVNLLKNFSHRYRPIWKSHVNSVTVLEIEQLVLCKSVRYTWKVVDQYIEKAFVVLFGMIVVSSSTRKLIRTIYLRRLMWFYIIYIYIHIRIKFRKSKII